MSLFDNWVRRIVAGDPMEPASPPPFAIGDRVVVSAAVMDGMFTSGRCGEVIGVEFITDREDAFGPWKISVLLDGDHLKMAFAASELTHEPKHQTVDEVAAEFGVDLNEPVPYVPVIGPEREQLPETPVYDQVRDEALAEHMFASKVETDLKTLTESRNVFRKEKDS
jgi:hypothetical protein